MESRNIVFKIKLADDLRRWTCEESTLSFDKVLDKAGSFFSTPADDTLLRYQDDDGDWVTMASQEDLEEAIRIAVCTTGGGKIIIRLDVTSPKPVRDTSHGSTVATPRLAELEETVNRLQREATKAATETEKASKKAATNAAKLMQQFGNAVKDLPIEQAIQQVVAALTPREGASADDGPIAAIFSNFSQQPDTVPPVVDSPPLVPPVVHPHVACDACEMCPLVGTRYKKKATNYDLCQADFDKLSQDEQAAFIQIKSPQQAWRPTRTKWHHRPASTLKPQARFVEDVNIPENTEILPGTQFTKIWRLRNSGPEAWPSNTRLIHIGGDKFEGDSMAPVAPAGPGQEVDVAVSLMAPQEPGRYVSYWRLAVPPQMRKFGQRIWVQVVIVNADGTVQFEANEALDVVHHGVECDISGINPVVGARYHKIGCDYDICEAEFSKLDKSAQRAFERIEQPGAQAVRMGSAEDDLNPAAVSEELEARHGWSTAAVSAVQSSALASTCENLRTILPAEQFQAVVSTIDPIFSVLEPFLVPCLNMLEPYIAAVTIPLDQEQLGLISNVVAAITEDPQAVTQSLLPAAPICRPFFDAQFLDMMAIAGAYECAGACEKNEWHYVTISPSADGAHLTWQNRAGVEWALHPTEDHLIYRVDDSCPYFGAGHIQLAVTLDEDGTVQSLSGPGGETYSKSTEFQPPSLPVVDHDVFPVDEPEPEPAAVEEMNCPGRHGLHSLTAHCDGMYCDRCRVSVPMGALLHGCRQCDFDFCEACFNMNEQEQEHMRQQLLLCPNLLGEQEPVRLQEALAEIDLSASMLLEMVEMEYAANTETETEQANAERAVAEAEAAAEGAVQDTPVSMAAAMTAMGVGQDDLSASMCAAIEHALNENVEQAEAAAMAVSAKEAAEAENVVAEADALAVAAAEAAAKAEVAAETAADAEKVAAEAEAKSAAEAANLASDLADIMAWEAAEVEAAAEAAAEVEKVAAEADAKAAAEAASEAEVWEDPMMHPLVEQLLKMGFGRNEASSALTAAGGDLEQAVNTLLSMSHEEGAAPELDPIVEDSSEWDKDWDAHLAELHEMGFDDAEANRAVLALTHGDLKDAVKELVNQERLTR